MMKQRQQRQGNGQGAPNKGPKPGWMQKDTPLPKKVQDSTPRKPITDEEKLVLRVVQMMRQETAQPIPSSNSSSTIQGNTPKKSVKFVPKDSGPSSSQSTAGTPQPSSSPQ